MRDVAQIRSRLRDGIRIAHENETIGPAGADLLDFSDIEIAQPVRLLHCTTQIPLRLGSGNYSVDIESGTAFTFVRGVSPVHLFDMEASDVSAALLDSEVVVLSNVRIVGDLRIGVTNPLFVTIDGGWYCDRCRFDGAISMFQVDFSCPVRFALCDFPNHTTMTKVVFRHSLQVIN